MTACANSRTLARRVQIERNCFNLARCVPARADDQAGIWRLADGVGGDLSEPDVPPVMMMVFIDFPFKCMLLAPGVGYSPA